MAGRARISQTHSNGNRRRNMAVTLGKSPQCSDSIIRHRRPVCHPGSNPSRPVGGRHRRRHRLLFSGFPRPVREKRRIAFTRDEASLHNGTEGARTGRARR